MDDKGNNKHGLESLLFMLAEECGSTITTKRVVGILSGMDFSFDRKKLKIQAEWSYSGTSVRALLHERMALCHTLFENLWGSYLDNTETIRRGDDGLIEVINVCIIEVHADSPEKVVAMIRKHPKLSGMKLGAVVFKLYLKERALLESVRRGTRQAYDAACK